MPTLEELQATRIPRMLATDLFEGLEPDDHPPLNRYLNIFAFTKEERCIACGAMLSGLLSSFSWGIVHGEGTCSCGWPIRAYHRPREGPVEFFALLLCYHPQELSRKTAD